MKKLFLILIMIFSLPAWTMCSISDGEKVCSSSGSSVLPLFQNQDITEIKQERSTGMPSDLSKPSGINSSFSKTQNQNGIHMQGSLGCQFGNCNKGANNDFLENQ